MNHVSTQHPGRLLPIALAALLLGLAAPAGAEEPSSDVPVPERAELLFAEGLRLMKADHCQDALPLFIESQRLDPAAATLTNVATCYVRIGKTASAYRTYQEASRAAILEQKTDLQQRTEQALVALAPTLTHLKIVPLGDAQLAQIRVNGQLVEDVRDPIPLDPGENFIEAVGPDRDPWRRTVRTLGEGALMVVEVPDLSSAPKPVPTVTTAPQTQARSGLVRDAGSSTDLKPYAIIGAGIGATGLAVGGVLALSAHAKQDAASQYCEGHYCTAAGIELRDQAETRADLATWSVGLGVVSLAASAILWGTSSSNPAPPAKLSYQPLVRVGPHSTFVALQGNL